MKAFCSDFLFTNGHLKPAALARRTLLVTSLATLAALAGCAGMGSSQPPQAQVRQLATERWQALLKSDFEKAYGYAAPSYRALKTLDHYRIARPTSTTRWISAEIVQVECLEAICTARVKLVFKPLAPGFTSTTLDTGFDEKWVFEGGKWWMLETV